MSRFDAALARLLPVSWQLPIAIWLHRWRVQWLRARYASLTGSERAQLRCYEDRLRRWQR